MRQRGPGKLNREVALRAFASLETSGKYRQIQCSQSWRTSASSNVSRQRFWMPYAIQSHHNLVWPWCRFHQRSSPMPGNLRLVFVNLKILWLETRKFVSRGYNHHVILPIEPGQMKYQARYTNLYLLYTSSTIGQPLWKWSCDFCWLSLKPVIPV
jgi:hypothetical protein